MPKPGEILAGKYRVEAVLGHGGMGVVVAAVHRDLGQRVAVKVMFSSARRSKEAVARFLREAQTASMLRSEHSVRIHDVGRLKRGEPYIVMEFLAGANLAQLLASRGPLPPSEAVDYVLQACEAIAEAHRIGIVHRDLKPANLFLTVRADRSPCVKVLDFGVSKVAWLAAEGFAPDLTATMELMGTPMYMSPEQVRASKAVDPRMDIWALGVVLYELMAGQPPFWADTLPAISARIVGDPPAPLRVVRPDIPAPLEAVVLRCLEKDAAARPQSVLDLARALAPFASRVGKASVREIEGIAQLPADALASEPLAIPADAARVPWQGETGKAWGTTHGRMRVGTRVGLLGVGTGMAAGLAAVVIWFAFMRAPPATPSVASSSASAAVLADVSDAAHAAPGEPLVTPAPAASASSSAPVATSSSPPATTAPRVRGGRGRDPLDERY